MMGEASYRGKNITSERAVKNGREMRVRVKSLQAVEKL